MKSNLKYKHIFVFSLLFQLFFSPLYAEYPDTIVGVIDLNYILSESDAAVEAAEQIENIAKQIEDEIKNNSWIVFNDYNTNFLFKHSNDIFWSNFLKKFGEKNKLFSNYPSDPTLN